MMTPGYRKNFLESSVLLNNRYQILQHLGAGGFGWTFLAEDKHLPTNPQCVIKMMQSQFQPLETLKLMTEAFEREAIALDELGRKSNSIPKLYAYFQEDNGVSFQYFIVQEYISGYTINQHVKEYGKVSEQELIQFLRPILKILDFLKEHEIIHRDIKPDNVILRSDGKHVLTDPVLIDFGSIKESIRTGSQTTVVVGTPGFMPSEQLVGHPDYTSDIFALGMTCIFMLTGKWPGEFEMDGNNSIIWEKHCNASQWMINIINKAIARLPRDRYQSGADMVADLDSVPGDVISKRTEKLIAVICFLSVAVALTVFISGKA